MVVSFIYLLYCIHVYIHCFIGQSFLLKLFGPPWSNAPREWRFVLFQSFNLAYWNFYDPAPLRVFLQLVIFPKLNTCILDKGLINQNFAVQNYWEAFEMMTKHMPCWQLTERSFAPWNKLSKPEKPAMLFITRWLSASREATARKLNANFFHDLSSFLMNIFKDFQCLRMLKSKLHELSRFHDSYILCKSKTKRTKVSMIPVSP